MKNTNTEKLTIFIDSNSLREWIRENISLTKLPAEVLNALLTLEHNHGALNKYMFKLKNLQREQQNEPN